MLTITVTTVRQPCSYVYCRRWLVWVSTCLFIIIVISSSSSNNNSFVCRFVAFYIIIHFKYSSKAVRLKRRRWRLICVSLALSQTPVCTARPRIRGLVHLAVCLPLQLSLVGLLIAVHLPVQWNCWNESRWSLCAYMSLIRLVINRNRFV